MQKRSANFIYSISIFIGVSILLFAYPLSFILPVSMSFENGLIENLQVAILVLSCIYNLRLFQIYKNRQIKIFNLWCAALSMLLAFRELSWGRVFYQIGIEEGGPVFVPMSDYAWRTETNILIGIYALILIFMLMKMPLMMMFHCRPPYLVLFIMILAVIFSYVGDHGMFFGKLQGQIIEEFGELSFYTLIPTLCIYYNRELSNKLQN